VMTSIDEGIRSLDNMDEFHMYVCQIGQKHCKIPGFQKEYFWVSTSTPSVCSLWHSRADKPQTLPHTARACAHKLARMSAISLRRPTNVSGFVEF
jgi:hypothetical protein